MSHAFSVAFVWATVAMCLVLWIAAAINIFRYKRFKRGMLMGLAGFTAFLAGGACIQNDDEMFWTTLSSSERTADFERYLERFPRGRHAVEASEKLRLLNQEVEREKVLRAVIEAAITYELSETSSSPFPPPYFLVIGSEDVKVSELPLLSPRLRDANTAIAFETKTTASGFYEVEGLFGGTGVGAGEAKNRRMTICFVDVHNPTRRTVLSISSSPPTKISSINGSVQASGGSYFLEGESHSLEGLNDAGSLLKIATEYMARRKQIE